MGLLRDAEEMDEIYATLFDLPGRDPRIGARLANAGLVVQFTLSNPNGIVTPKMRDKLMRSGMFGDYILGDSNIEPDVVFEIFSGLSNRFFRGQISIVRGLMKGQIKTKGRRGKALNAVPLIEPVLQIYPKLLRERGWNHLLV